MRALFRHFWLVPLSTLLISAWLAASIVSHVLDAWLIRDADAATPVRVARKPPAPQTAPRKEVDELLARNMFCPTCEPAKPEPAGAPAEVGPMTLPLVLIATVVVNGGDGAGVATILDPATGLGGAYAVGDVIAGFGPVRAVGGSWVDVLHAKSARVARLHLVGTAPVAAAAAPKPAPRAQAETEGVKLVADNHYEIDRGLMDKVLADPDSIRGSARVFPALENGKAVGFKLSSVRDNSLVAQLGLRSGDQIRAINGMPLTSPDRAVEAYTKLRSASELRLAVWRGGSPLEMEYRIR